MVGRRRFYLLAVFDQHICFCYGFLIIKVREGHLQQILSNANRLKHIINILNHLQVDLFKLVLQSV